MKGQIIRDLPNEEYHNGEQWREYLSSTTLKNYNISPKQARYIMDNPSEQTEAMKFGSILHDLMATLTEVKGDWDKGIETWLARIARFVPPVNPKTGKPYGAATKAYAEAYEKFLEDNAGKTIVDPKSLELAVNMANSALNECGLTSQTIRGLMQRGKAEVSHFVEYNGIKCKYRPDLEISDTKADIIVDWKTVATNDLRERSVKNIVRDEKYQYHVSAAYYQMLAHEEDGRWRTFMLCLMSKQPPYDCLLVNLDKYAYDYDRDNDILTTNVGVDIMERLFSLHCECKEKNRWPGAESNVPCGKGELPILTIMPDQWEVDREMYR